MKFQQFQDRAAAVPGIHPLAALSPHKAVQAKAQSQILREKIEDTLQQHILLVLAAAIDLAKWKREGSSRSTWMPIQTLEQHESQRLDQIFD